VISDVVQLPVNYGTVSYYIVFIFLGLVTIKIILIVNFAKISD